MKAIILAAGKSSRLYPKTLKYPKCLLEITQNFTIIDLQLLQLRNLGIDDIVIVTGYKNDKIEERIQNSVRYFYYEDYSIKNNLHTLASVSQELNQKCLIIFSDVVVSKAFLNKCITSNDDFNLMIDTNNISEKTMRVLIKNNSLLDIGSHILPSDGDANFIGIAKYSKVGAQLLSNHIQKLSKIDKHANDYYTIALTEIAKKGYTINFTRNDNFFWDEIDYLQDYQNLINNYQT